MLQNILIGMQHKLVELQTEKHMKVFGLQIKSFKAQDERHEDPPPKKECQETSYPEPEVVNKIRYNLIQRR